MNDQNDPLLLDHEADGIRELDNKLPRWWVWLFYLTIIAIRKGISVVTSLLDSLSRCARLTPFRLCLPMTSVCVWPRHSRMPGR